MSLFLYMRVGAYVSLCVYVCECYSLSQENCITLSDTRLDAIRCVSFDRSVRDVSIESLDNYISTRDENVEIV